VRTRDVVASKRWFEHWIDRAYVYCVSPANEQPDLFNGSDVRITELSQCITHNSGSTPSISETYLDLNVSHRHTLATFDYRARFHPLEILILKTRYDSAFIEVLLNSISIFNQSNLSLTPRRYESCSSLSTYTEQPQDGHADMTLGLTDFRETGAFRFVRSIFQPFRKTQY